MLNRTTRTLSANTNRLDLGTRSFATVADVNNGLQTLRLRRASSLKRKISICAGATWGIRGSVAEPRVPVSPSSPPSYPWPTAGQERRARVEVVAEAPPAERWVVEDDRAQRPDGSRDRLQPRDHAQHPGRAAHRWPVQPDAKRGPGRSDSRDAMARMTLSPARALRPAGG
jgi:hypothetical protein